MRYFSVRIVAQQRTRRQQQQFSYKVRRGGGLWYDIVGVLFEAYRPPDAAVR